MFSGRLTWTLKKINENTKDEKEQKKEELYNEMSSELKEEKTNSI